MGTAKVYVLPVQRDAMERISEHFFANGTGQKGECRTVGTNLVGRMEFGVTIRNEGELRFFDGRKPFPDLEISATAGLENLQLAGRE
jgi:hypothetical protein